MGNAFCSGQERFHLLVHASWRSHERFIHHRVVAIPKSHSYLALLSSSCLPCGSVLDGWSWASPLAASCLNNNWYCLFCTQS
jgi:hypothetical protein